ncbi:MAG: hypothetical protein A2X56_06440 [Nitrospirae bacterium GWC2_57_13]|nr:MAG: hypothetical protein A2072_00715 [Nitrospirae bacterium GWC1_57_7]OGW29724.1 MAG: hypothetical protein A2X56_06440 [Nitrospirae bacterium GWC2_57_13]OGW42496.1 MAG: hypothetical protein A2X57_10565 [Nitrospirae bacterium GWD2_57_8]HAR45291.1 hypothetical protein [Nitrospiraceae bacterium]HAS54924.1 hypothetical protein [Nitrospiraceae bacterium]
MKLRSRVLFLVGLVFFAGCGSFTPPLQTGQEIPAGKVLVIGKFMIDPPWYLKGSKPEPGEKQENMQNIMVAMTRDLSKKVKENTMYRADMNLDVTLYESFYYAIPPGTMYIRNTQVMKPTGWTNAMGATMFDVLKFYRNLKLDIPANAKAVYIGTILYKHDGKRMLSVTVQDEYGQMLKDLPRMNIPGLKSGDVVKRLAVIK